MTQKQRQQYLGMAEKTAAMPLSIRSGGIGMRYTIQAACGCVTGKIRKNNEDNFYFDGKCLEMEHDGLRHPVEFERALKNGLCLAIFDGMGGENYGEMASFAAARQMQETERRFADFFIPERKYLGRLVEHLNCAVNAVQKEMCTEHMGSTMVSLYFSGCNVYVCNVGDSRAYRLREGAFQQLSVDHVEKRPGTKKAPLTQYLGFDTEEVVLAPYIAKGELQRGDWYLLCSDGLTDMVTNFEIADIILKSKDSLDCVQRLIDAAMEHGGRDNISVIACNLK